MHFSFKFGLILLIIQATLSLPVEKIDNNNVVNNSSESEYIDSYIGDTKKVKPNLFDDLTSLIEILNNTQQEVERINKTERVNYGDEAGSQEFYERSKSLLQKMNRSIKRELISTNELNTINLNGTHWIDWTTKLKKLHNESIDTLIDIAEENNYVATVMSSNPMSSTLSNLISNFNIIYEKISETLEFLMHEYYYQLVKNNQGTLKYDYYYSNNTMVQEITNDANMFLTYLIKKLSNSQQKIQSDFRSKGLNSKRKIYYDYNKFFIYMKEKFTNTQNINETQVEGIIPELNFYIYNTLNAAKQIQANINHTTFRGIFLSRYEHNRMALLRKIIQYIQKRISAEDTNDYRTQKLVAGVKDDIKMISEKLQNTIDSINPKVSHIYYFTSDILTLENVGAWTTKYFSLYSGHITNDVFSP